MFILTIYNVCLYKGTTKHTSKRVFRLDRCWYRNRKESW